MGDGKGTGGLDSSATTGGLYSFAIEVPHKRQHGVFAMARFALTTRRDFLKIASTAALGTSLGASCVHGDAPRTMPPVRQITRGPKFHWFGYYDKLQFDPTSRYVLGMEVDFEHRSPAARRRDQGRHGRSGRRRPLDRARPTTRPGAGSRAACCSGGPASASEILWNDREGDHYVCHILDVKTRATRTVPHPVYAVSPDGRWAVAPDFGRLADIRPGYGYAGIPDPHRDVLAPHETGIFRIDLETGEQELIISVADVPELAYPHGDLSGMKHWFNHLLVNPDGSRFSSSIAGKTGRRDVRNADDHRGRRRLGSAGVDRLRDTSRTSSGAIREHILAYGKHPPRGEWDFSCWRTEPSATSSRSPRSVTDGRRPLQLSSRQALDSLRHLSGRAAAISTFSCTTWRRRRVHLGDVSARRRYQGEWRCDTHPRLQPRRPQRGDRFAAYRPGPPVAPDRHQCCSWVVGGLDSLAIIACRLVAFRRCDP